MTEFLNQAASAWWSYFAQASWQATLLVLVILILVRLRPRWPARLHWGLLMIGVFKFALPPLVPVPADILGRLQPALERPERSRQAASLAGLTRASEPAGIDRAQPSPGREAASGLVAGLDWRVGLMMLHLAGTGLLLGLIAARQRRLMRIRDSAQPVGDRELELFLADSIRRNGVRRAPELRVSNDNAGPLAMGIFRPAIVIPRALFERLPRPDLRIVLAHELAHLRRRDLWTQVLTTSLLAIWWFHPLYWVLFVKVRRVCEDCCDDDVISRGFASADEYCGALLHTSAALGSNRFNFGAGLAFAESLHPIAGRLRRIMQDDIPRPARISTPSRIAIAATALLVLPGIRPAGSRASGSEGARQTTASISGTAQGQFPVAELFSDDPVRRAAAACRLGRTQAVEAIPALIGLLGDEIPIPVQRCWERDVFWSPAFDSWKRFSPGEAGAIALASLGGSATHSLIAALNHPDAVVRRNAAWALGELRNPRLPGMPEVEPLMRTLADSDVWVRRTAAWALGETKDGRAVDSLSNMLEDPEAEVRKHAAAALGEIRSRRAISGLVRGLEDGDDRVRRQAAWALGEIADPEAVTSLSAALSDPSLPVRAMAAWALSEIGERSPSPSPSPRPGPKP
jgi:HEAT repeat protein/beta-lactamase regulating signal transducer with metallopeptidase domain